MNFLMTVLAQTAQQSTGDPQSRGIPGRMWIGILVVVGVFYFMLFRGSRKGPKQRTQMLASLKKNDRVMTIGGIVGTVVAIKDNQIIIKVDETTNTKMTFTKDAIRTVVQDDTDLTVDSR